MCIRDSPTTSGILRSMNKDNPEYLYMAIDGVENCRNALRDIIDAVSYTHLVYIKCFVGQYHIVVIIVLSEKLSLIHI